MQLEKAKGRQINPETLTKYEQVRAILLERPGSFSKRELCVKHEINYHNFCQWLRNKENPRAGGVSLKQPPVFITKDSIIIATSETLTSLIREQLAEAIKVALYEGIKSNKIKLLKL